MMCVHAVTCQEIYQIKVAKVKRDPFARTGIVPNGL